jgi:uncharacterized Ntn-hydrolase superfamily protein
MTFSIVARSDDARMFGIAIASASAAVAAHCSHARAGIGAVATQNITDPILGPRMLDGLRCGASAAEAIAGVLDSTDHGPYRQLLAIGSTGSPAHHCGAHALGLAASASSQHAVAAGNLLANRQVPAAMIAAFDTTFGDFADRLLAALQAGAAAGGAAAALHSAGLLVVREVPWPIIDLRVDWSEGDPIAALNLLWKRYAPQVDEGVRQALQPAQPAAAGVADS